jgi:LPXTG-motif cell wall-anchored protein
MKKMATFVGAGVAATLLAVGVSAPASGAGAIATPDPSIYAIGYDNDYLYTVDISTGAGTQYANPIGMGPVQHLGGSFNPVDGLLYATNGDNNQCEVWSISTETGIGELVLTPSFTHPDSGTVFVCLAMVFSPEGDFYLSTRSTNGTNYINKVDLATGDLIQSWEAPLASTPNFIVVSPEDGLFYMQTSAFDDDMFTFDPSDPTSGAFVNVANGNDQTMYGAAFLPDGTILANAWSDLVTVDLATLGAWTVIGPIDNTDIGVLVNGTQYWPAPVEDTAPQLPATGIDSSGLVGGFLGAMLLVVVGAVLRSRNRHFANR